jgi:hypothetical protein
VKHVLVGPWLCTRVETQVRRIAGAVSRAERRRLPRHRLSKDTYTEVDCGIVHYGSMKIIPKDKACPRKRTLIMEKSRTPPLWIQKYGAAGHEAHETARTKAEVATWYVSELRKTQKTRRNK